jgi:hypothetical protein
MFRMKVRRRTVETVRVGDVQVKIYRRIQTVAGHQCPTFEVGFHGAAPTVQRPNPNHAAATDLATAITLANELRAALVEKGIIKGGV